MTAVLVALAVAVLLVPRPQGGVNAPVRIRRPDLRRSSPRIAVNTVGAIAVAAVFPLLLGLPGVPLALPAAFLVHRLVPRESTRGRERHDLALLRALPGAVDLLAALLRAGLPDSAAVRLAAAAAADPLGDLLTAVARRRALGADPATAWRSAASEPVLTGLASAMARHAESGAGVAAVLDRLAADTRQEYFARAQAAARAASVRTVLPLAVCFLPSFFLLAVVPIVVSFGAELGL